MKLVYYIAAAVLALALLALCWGWLTEDPERTCIRNLSKMRSVSYGYRSKHSLPEDALINPGNLADLLPDGEVPTCPLSDKQYPPFVWKTGPTCPNSKIHTMRAW